MAAWQQPLWMRRQITAAGMDDRFRLGDNHAADIAAVLAELKKRYADAPVFLVGTSRGTISAAAAGRTLADRIAGVVLTSTLFNAARSGPGLSGFDFTTVNTPVLFVHHADDGCFVTPYRGAQSLVAKFPPDHGPGWRSGALGSLRGIQRARVSWQRT